MKRRLWIAGAAAAGLGGGLTLQAWRSPERTDGGDPWASTFTDLDGRALPLAALRGRPLLLNFWASWCAPCVAELPELRDFMARPAQAGWRWLAVAVDTPEAVRRFLAHQRLDLPVALAGSDGMALSKRLGNSASTLPFSALFDADGCLRQARKGVVDADLLAGWRRSLD